MHSLPKRCIALVLLASLLLQSCSEDRHSKALRMAGSAEQESTDKKPPAQSTGGQGNSTASEAAGAIQPILASGQAHAHPEPESLATAPTPLVATIAQPDNTASTQSDSFSPAPPISLPAPASGIAAPRVATVLPRPSAGLQPSGQPQGARPISEGLKTQEQTYAQKLKRLVSDNRLEERPDGMREIAAVFNHLAALHQEQGRETGLLSHYTDAAICYQHALRVCDKECSSYDVQMEEAYKGLAQIRAAMIASIKQAQVQEAPSNSLTPEELREAIDQDKQVLKDLRKDTEKRLAEIDAAEQDNEALYIEKSRALFADIAERVGTFLKRLYEESEDVLEKAPCKYTVLGLGSMALQQMTPYSDLEFAILIEDSEDEAVLAERRAYFRQLSHLVHYRVINLGETVLPRDKYGVSLDHLSKRGINFDLGGKTPLGRSDKKYDLIQPVVGMLRYLRNEQGKAEHIDKLLPFMLERTCYVHGDKSLHDAYAKESKEFLERGKTAEGVPVYQARALKKLLEGAVEMDYNQPGPDIAKPHQKGDLADFEPEFGFGTEGRLYDVKQEIYRLPDRLLYRLAMYYGLLPTSGWDAVDQLRSKEVSSAAAVPHLQYAVSFATLLRLRTYLRYGQQKETMDVLHNTTQGEQQQQVVSQSFVPPLEALQEDGSLFKYYYTALPLYERMAMFFNKLKSSGQPSRAEEEYPFQNYDFYLDNGRVKGSIHLRLLQYEAAEKCLQQDLNILKKTPNIKKRQEAIALKLLGSARSRLGKYDEAKTAFQEAYKIFDELKGSDEYAQLQAIEILACLGNISGDLGVYQDAQAYHKQSLELLENTYGKESSEVAVPLANLGNVCFAAGKPVEAKEYYAKALGIFKKHYGENHPLIASSLDNMGSVCSQAGEHAEAKEHYAKALGIFKKHYGENHPSIASNLENKGIVCSQAGEHAEAKRYHMQCLQVFRKIYKNDHPTVAKAFQNLGATYFASEDYREAKQFCKQAIEMGEKIYGKDNAEVAAPLAQLGAIHAELGDIPQAIEDHKQALEIFKKVHHGGDHPDVAQVLLGLGSCHNMSGEYAQAAEHYREALRIYKKCCGENHPHAALTSENLGNTLENLGKACFAAKEYAQAKEHHAEAFKIFEERYGREHPKVIYTLVSLWFACMSNEDFEASFKMLGDILNRYHAAANKAYAQQDVAGVIRNYEQALALPPELLVMVMEKDEQRSIFQNLGGMYHVAALGASEAASRQAYIDKATTAFESAVGASPTAGLLTEYANFLLATRQLAKAYNYLVQAIASGDGESGLSYGLIERATVLPLLQARIDQAGEVQVRGIDYALYLLIHCYEDFAQAGIVLEKDRADYLKDYARGISDRAGQEGQEKQDEMARFLLGSLQSTGQVGAFVEACRAGDEDAITRISWGAFAKDLCDPQGNPLICWMAQHEMVTTMEQVLHLGWDPNLSNTSGVYPLHYGAVKNPTLTKALLDAGAHPFVQTPKGNTPTQAARKNGQVTTLVLLLPHTSELSFTDAATFEASYKAYMQGLATHPLSAEALLAALEIGLQLGDAALVLAIKEKVALAPVLAQLCERYPLASEAIQARLDSMLS